MHSPCSMGAAVFDPWKRVRERTIDCGDDELSALLRDADRMRRFIEHVKWASTWYGSTLHADAGAVLALLGRPLDSAAADRIAGERREPMRIEEEPVS